MADHQFFKKSADYTLQDIVQHTDCQVTCDDNPSFTDVADLGRATASDISFFDNIKYKDAFLETKAGACFVSPDMAALAPKHTLALVSANPYKAYALTAQLFYPDAAPAPHIHKTASIGDGVSLGRNVYIGHNVVIGDNAAIGDNAWIEHNAVIGESVKIGRDVRIGAGATVSHAIIGDFSRLYTGVRVGQDGFGFALDPAGHVKVPQLGRVIIGSHVEIGANTTIDRGAGPDTVIGDGTWIDNLVQIAHNVKIGRGCVIIAQVGISGSTKLGDYVVVAGQVGIAGHLNIGTGARLAAQSGVMTDVPAGQDYSGSPAMPKSQHFRHIATLNRLIKKSKKG